MALVDLRNAVSSQKSVTAKPPDNLLHRHFATFHQATFRHF